MTDAIAIPRPGAKFRPEPLERRTFAKVRRHSRYAGGEDWPRISWAEANRRIRALKLYRESLRKPGQRWGADGTISAGAVGLYELMCNIAVKGMGRLEPSVRWLAETLNVPMKVVHAWKAQLKSHGFLDWRRRYVTTGRQGRRGPQVEQTSNAYVLKAPERALAALAKRLGGRGRSETREQMASRLRAMADEAETRRREARAKLGESLEILGMNVHAAAEGAADGDPPCSDGT